MSKRTLAPALLALPVLAGCSNADTVSAKVVGISRTCDFLTQGGEKKSGSCYQDNTFERMRAQDRATRTETLIGTAKVDVSYSTADGVSRIGRIEFDGRDDEFYRLNLGDALPIRVDRDDPARLWAA